jgi:prolyl-tRNA editing enzyme YbaK/EbsC (Cys-tRNA(Pro) deacylase)
MSKGYERVHEYMSEYGIEARSVTLDTSTRTSRMAADALGCTVPEIAKSIVFTDGERAYVVVISGDRRVDLGKLGAAVGAKVTVGDADAVRRLTGYVIGGVPPFPHDDGVVVILDRSLERFRHVWAAGGAPNSVVRFSLEQLHGVLGPGTVDVAE